VVTSPVTIAVFRNSTRSEALMLPSNLPWITTALAITSALDDSVRAHGQTVAAEFDFSFHLAVHDRSSSPTALLYDDRLADMGDF